MREGGPRISRTALVGGFAAVLLVAGIWLMVGGSPDLRGITGPNVEGRVLTHVDDELVRLGPAGWHTVTRGDQLEVRQGRDLVRTIPRGESGLTVSPEAISPDGVVVSIDGDTLTLHGEGDARTVDTRAIVAAHDSDGPWPGNDLKVLGMTTNHVVVMTCLADAPAALRDETPGSHVGVAGVDLADGTVSFVEPLDIACGPNLQTYFTLEAAPQEVAFVSDLKEPGVTAVDLTNGRTLKTWPTLESSDVAVQGTTALVVDEPRIEVVDLRAGRTLAREDSCPRFARTRAPVSGQVPTESALVAWCIGEGAWVWDGSALVDAPPPPLASDAVGEEEVTVGRWAVRREGDTVQARDLLGRHAPFAMTGVDDQARVLDSGRLLTFFTPGRGNGIASQVVSYDTADGSLVLEAKGRFNSGIKVSPKGALHVRTKDEDWVAGVGR